MFVPSVNGVVYFTQTLANECKTIESILLGPAVARFLRSKRGVLDRFVVEAHC